MKLSVKWVEIQEHKFDYSIEKFKNYEMSKSRN
jgi:hypothetical protein